MGEEDDVEFEVRDLGPCPNCDGEGSVSVGHDHRDEAACGACEGTGSKTIIHATFEGCGVSGSTEDQAARRVLWMVLKKREERGVADIEAALDEIKTPTHEGDVELSVIGRVRAVLRTLEKVAHIANEGDEDDASAMVLDIRKALEGPK